MERSYFHTLIQRCSAGSSPLALGNLSADVHEMKMGRYPLCMAYSLAVGLAAAGSPCGARAQEISAPPPQFEDPAGMDENAPPIELSVSYTADVNADVAGGARQGAAYLGKLAVIAEDRTDRVCLAASGRSQFSTFRPLGGEHLNIPFREHGRSHRMARIGTQSEI